MESYLREMEGKMAHDIHHHHHHNSGVRRMLVSGPVIVGAGPSGMAVAACLRARGVPSLVLERADCIASLWQHKTYDRLCLHLPKHFCELPMVAFPENYPEYPSKRQFVDYLVDYAERFDIKPAFNEAVVRAEFDGALGMWKVRTASTVEEGRETEYVCRWLVAATGENAEVVVPKIEGMEEFGGEMEHSSKYRSGEGYNGKRVLVVGCGNSGMEVSLDLCHHNAMPSLVVRHAVHVLPKEMLGRSTFDLSMWLMRWLPVSIVDRLLLLVARVVMGDTTKFGITRPNIGPLQLKHISGKTPVLDVGTLDKIRSGHIKVTPGIRRLKHRAAEFVDGRTENFDAVLLATGFKSNVPFWLKENDMFSKDGMPKKPFPNGWKGSNGLYAVGFTKRGLLGASTDAKSVAEDIERYWASESKHLTAFA